MQRHKEVIIGEEEVNSMTTTVGLGQLEVNAKVPISVPSHGDWLHVKQKQWKPPQQKKFERTLQNRVHPDKEVKPFTALASTSANNLNMRIRPTFIVGPGHLVQKGETEPWKFQRRETKRGVEWILVKASPRSKQWATLLATHPSPIMVRGQCNRRWHHNVWVLVEKRQTLIM